MIEEYRRKKMLKDTVPDEPIAWLGLQRVPVEDERMRSKWSESKPVLVDTALTTLAQALTSRSSTISFRMMPWWWILWNVKDVSHFLYSLCRHPVGRHAKFYLPGCPRVEFLTTRRFVQRYARQRSPKFCAKKESQKRTTSRSELECLFYDDEEVVDDDDAVALWTTTIYTKRKHVEVHTNSCDGA